MANLTQKQQEKLKLLEKSLGVEDEGVLGTTRKPNPVLCASIKRDEQTQYNFMVIYQTIVLIFAVVVLALLIYAGWLIATGGASSKAVIAGAGALVAGVAAAFLLRQRQDARDTHKAALALLEKYNCP